MSAAVVRVLAVRDLRLFFRQPSRLLGAVAPPLLFWAVLGAGLAPSFRMPGADSGPGYVAYTFPGIVMMMVLFAAISATMSVIEDRHRGFLQQVLAAPGSRGSLAVGKCVGGAAVSLLHAVLFFALLPLAGYSPAEVNWPVALLALASASLLLTAVGFILAWRLDSSSGYHVVMSIVLIPLWALSGALFPITAEHRVLGWMAKVNPLAYAVEGFRRGLEGAAFADVWTQLVVTVVAAMVAVLIASRSST